MNIGVNNGTPLQVCKSRICRHFGLRQDQEIVLFLQPQGEQPGAMLEIDKQARDVYFTIHGQDPYVVKARSAELLSCFRYWERHVGLLIIHVSSVVSITFIKGTDMYACNSKHDAGGNGTSWTATVMPPERRVFKLETDYLQRTDVEHLRGHGVKVLGKLRRPAGFESYATYDWYCYGMAKHNRACSCRFPGEYTNLLTKNLDWLQTPEVLWALGSGSRIVYIERPVPVYEEPAEAPPPYSKYSLREKDRP